MLRLLSALCLLLTFASIAMAQEVVPIQNYSVNAYGQVQLSIEGESGKYYILMAQQARPSSGPHP